MHHSDLNVPPLVAGITPPAPIHPMRPNRLFPYYLASHIMYRIVCWGWEVACLRAGRLVGWQVAKTHWWKAKEENNTFRGGDALIGEPILLNLDHESPFL